MLADKVHLFATQCFGNKRRGRKLHQLFDKSKEGHHFPAHKNLRRICDPLARIQRDVAPTGPLRDAAARRTPDATRHESASRETFCLLHIEHHLLKYALRIIAVAEEAAIDAIEPLLPLPVQNAGPEPSTT